MKSRTLISFSQRPPLNPSHGSVLGSVSSANTAADMISSLCLRQRCQAPVLLVFNPNKEAVCRAIINSSLVGITHTETLLVLVEIRGPLLSFDLLSSSIPNQADASQIRLRTSAEFSPMPAVNTSASSPPSTALSAPISFATR